VKAEHLPLSRVKKTELFDFMKETRNKEEYRRAKARRLTIWNNSQEFLSSS
jgi:hypothetical protein